MLEFQLATTHARTVVMFAVACTMIWSAVLCAVAAWPGSVGASPRGWRMSLPLLLRLIVGSCCRGCNPCAAALVEVGVAAVTCPSELGVGPPAGGMALQWLCVALVSMHGPHSLILPSTSLGRSSGAISRAAARASPRLYRAGPRVAASARGMVLLLLLTMQLLALLALVLSVFGATWICQLLCSHARLPWRPAL